MQQIWLCVVSSLRSSHQSFNEDGYINYKGGLAVNK